VTRPLRLRPRAVVALGLASVGGLAAFTWPLVVTPGAVLESTSAPLVFALLLPVLLAVVLAEMSEGGMDTKALAMLGVLGDLHAAGEI
jgi:energy-coupling factor transport system substrate-specific component